MMRRIIIIFLILLWVCGHAQKGRESAVAGSDREKELTAEVRPALFALTMVMVHDVVNPPAASRYYSYVMLAAYDLVSRNDASVVSPGVFIRHYPSGGAPGFDSG